MRLERNPYFRVWSPLARPDGYPDVIEAAFGVGADEAVAAIRAGRSDYAWVDRFGREHGRRAGARPGPAPRGGRSCSPRGCSSTRGCRRSTASTPAGRSASRSTGPPRWPRSAARTPRGRPAASSRRRSPGYRPGCPTRDLARGPPARAALGHPRRAGHAVERQARLHLAEPGHHRRAARDRLSHPRAQRADGAVLPAGGERRRIACRSARRHGSPTTRRTPRS